MLFIKNKVLRNKKSWDFPCGPVVKSSTAWGMGLIPGRGTKIPHAAWCGTPPQKKRRRRKKQKV